MRTKLALVVGSMLLILVVLMAQPVPVVRVLRDLQDVKPKVPPNNGDSLIYNSTSGKWTNGTPSGGGLLSGSGTNNTLAYWTGTNSLGSIANGVGILTNDGSGGFGFTTNVTQDVTYNNFSTTNLTVLNTLTVSNIVVTNVTVQNNLTVSNLYTVNGNHNTLIVTNYVRMPWVTLTMSGSNVSTIDLAAGSMFRVLVTNNAFFGAVSNHPGTNTAQVIQIAVIQDATGARTVTMTNGTWQLSSSSTSSNAVPSVTTNANGITLLSFVTSPSATGKLVGVPASIGP